MIPIKFRGRKWDADLEELDFIYGYLADVDVINDKFGTGHVVWEKTIGQFTGVTDKNKKEIYQDDFLRIDKSNLSESFKYSKAGEVMVEKELDAFIILIEKSDYLNIKIKTYLQKDGKLLTKKEYYGEDVEDESLYFETGIDVRFLKYIEPFCEIIGNMHQNPELIEK